MPASPPPPPSAGRRRSRLSTRLVAGSLLLLLLVQLAGYGVVSALIERNARRSLDQQLGIGARVWQELVGQRAQRLIQGTSVLAQDYGLRDAFAADDRPTLESALENHGARLDAALGAVLDPAFEPRAEMLPSGGADMAGLAERARSFFEHGWGLVAVNGRPYLVVIVPMRAPRTIGWVMMGFRVDRSQLDQLYGITGVNATLLVQERGQTPRALDSSLGDLDATALSMPASADADMAVAGDLLRLRDLPLAGDDRRQITLRLSGSLAEALTPFQQLQGLLAGVTALGVLLFGAGSLWLSRRVTRPLARLVGAADRLGRGDYDTPVAAGQRQDEVGELATAFERMREGLRAEMYFDQRLTRLPNRLQFSHQLALRLEAGEPVAVLLLGLNRFKHVNRVLGYEAGDQLLVAMAERLQRVVRPGDFVARLGGDVFALLLPGAGVEAARRAAVRVGAELEQPLALDDKQVDLHASIGMACAPVHATAADRLLASAEVALYWAKERREAAVVYDPVFDKRSPETLSLLGELRHARDNGELRLHLQPQVALATGAITGCEALLRWQHPVRGMVAPGLFIPYAEDTPIIRDLTLWVLEAVVREQAALRAQGVERISVNLSARDLMDQDLPVKLDAILARHGGRAEGLCLETTESAVMGDIERARLTLDRLRQRGYQLSIDDFGTGHSSMEYLKHLPVDELKIDMAFVKGMQSDPRNVSLVRAMVDLGHALGMTVVAEGVENAALAQQLVTLGCDEGQGWCYGKPMPAAELVGWAAAYRERLAAVQPGLLERPTRPAPLH